MTVLKNDLILRAARREPVSRVPVWLMRQAGRCDPQYRALRESDGRSLEMLFQDPERCIEVSLLPKRFGVDAIIMFQDILTPLTSMGAPFFFRPGPILDDPIRSERHIQALKPVDLAQLRFVEQTIKGLLKELDGDLPLLGFAGSPVTLSFFLIAGKSPMSDSEMVFRFIEEEPALFQQLLDRLADMTIDYLNMQIESGVHAFQLFESLGHVFSREMYERFVLPTHQKIFEALPSSVPRMLFVRECDFLDLMLQSGASVLSVGKCVDLEKAQTQVDGKVALQGNVDNDVLAHGSLEAIEQEVQRCLRQGGGTGHILNLNHGVLPDTPLENVLHLIQSARKLQGADAVV